MQLKFYTFILLSLMLTLFSCSKKKAGTGDSRPPILSLAGMAALPAPFAVYEIFDSAQGYAGISRFSCPAQANGSLLQGPTLILQTMNNCSDKQWIYFYQTNPVDLSAYAQGSIELRLEATGGDMSISAQIEDDATKVSDAVDLASVGFDKSKSGLEQKVVIPVASFGKSSVDLSKLKRLLQLDVTCASTNCYLSLFSIRWLGPLKASSAFTATQHCDPFACHALHHATYRVYQPTSNGWTATTAGAGITGDDGTYETLLTRSQIDALTADGRPLLLAMAEDGALFTFSVVFSSDDLAGDSIVLDTSLASTIAEKLVCPGGRFPPPTGAYCYTPTTAERSDLQNAIDAYLSAHPVSTVDLVAIAQGAIADSTVAASLKVIVTDSTITPTASTIKDGEGTYPLPPPNDGAATATALPANLPEGTYLFNCQVCGAGTCQQSSHTVTVTSGAASTITSEITNVFHETSLDCSGQGVTCQDRYSGFNGVSFTASRFIKACSGDVCATASVSIKMTLQ